MGVHLPEDRVERACIMSRRILTAPENKGEWSFWRARRQSKWEDPRNAVTRNAVTGYSLLSFTELSRSKSVQ